MRLAVLCNPESWYLRDLQRAAGARCQVEALPFSRMTCSIAGGEVRVSSRGRSLSSFDAVLVRTMPPGSLEQVVYRMDALGRIAAANQTLVLNPPRTIETAVDKFLTTARLAEQGLPVPATTVCQTADEAMDAFERLGADVVVKPIFGSEGRGITRVSDPILAARAFTMLERINAVIYLQQFIAHPGYDLRILLIGERLYAMQRHNELDWRTNVSLGGTGRAVEPPRELEQLARAAADAIDAPVAGVDILTAPDGQPYVLEVNAVPGWKALARVTPRDVAEDLLQFVQRRLAAS